MTTPSALLRRPGLDLFLVSGLVLFLELACIRWFPSHVLYLTFFTNAVLLAASSACRSAACWPTGPARLLKHTPLFLALALGAGLSTVRLRAYDRAATSTWPTRRTRTWSSSAPRSSVLKQVEFRFPLEIVLGVFFVLIALVMVGPGQEMGRAFNRVPHRGRRTP